MSRTFKRGDLVALSETSRYRWQSKNSDGLWRAGVIWSNIVSVASKNGKTWYEIFWLDDLLYDEENGKNQIPKQMAFMIAKKELEKEFRSYHNTYSTEEILPLWDGDNEINCLQNYSKDVELPVPSVFDLKQSIQLLRNEL